MKFTELAEIFAIININETSFISKTESSATMYKIWMEINISMTLACYNKLWLAEFADKRARTEDDGVSPSYIKRKSFG